jgi:hypothetical protein
MRRLAQASDAQLRIGESITPNVNVGAKLVPQRRSQRASVVMDSGLALKRAPE